MASVGVIDKALSFLYVQNSCWMWVVHKGVRLRLGRHWVTSRSFASSFSWGSVLCMRFCVVCILEVWVIVDAVNQVYVMCEGVVLLSCGMEEVVVYVSVCVAG